MPYPTVLTELIALLRSFGYEQSSPVTMWRQLAKILSPEDLRTRLERELETAGVLCALIAGFGFAVFTAPPDQLVREEEAGGKKVFSLPKRWHVVILLKGLCVASCLGGVLLSTLLTNMLNTIPDKGSATVQSFSTIFASAIPLPMMMLSCGVTCLWAGFVLLSNRLYKWWISCCLAILSFAYVAIHLHLWRSMEAFTFAGICESLCGGEVSVSGEPDGGGGCEWEWLAAAGKKPGRCRHLETGRICEL